MTDPVMSGDGFILASASPRRLHLLAQIGLTPDAVHPTDINEDPIPGELPGPHALRLAQEKAQAALRQLPGSVILAADTVVGVGRRILPKTMERDEAKMCLSLMSGRSHRVFTGVCVIDADGLARSKVSETRLKMKRLSDQEMTRYLDSEEWRGKAGGYGIQGRAGTLIHHISGSYTGVVGLPVYETGLLLAAAGIIS
ncbi:Maf-like protein [Algimonas ampicilliniresistens]|uniref:dTTP/UTP pyrophosphatase n=1 Tax=Algimonas ampicilliniresistens TaxID=1298735 RepID=A0ABQ5V942_9PROT|nr:Maf family nucleotide pyrophosphatase [Algimonas ampicilliniresistens]GLQ23363.1 Maf-like protein [Algimonas ampicilliniresistens]